MGEEEGEGFSIHTSRSRGSSVPLSFHESHRKERTELAPPREGNGGALGLAVPGKGGGVLHPVQPSSSQFNTVDPLIQARLKNTHAAAPILEGGGGGTLPPLDPGGGGGGGGLI